MQNNTDKELSDLLKNKLEDTSFDVSEDLWDKTFSKYRQERLGQRRRRAIGWIGSIAGIAIIAAGIAFFSGDVENAAAKLGKSVNCQEFVFDDRSFGSNDKTDSDKQLNPEENSDKTMSELPSGTDRKLHNNGTGNKPPKNTANNNTPAIRNKLNTGKTRTNDPVASKSPIKEEPVVPHNDNVVPETAPTPVPQPKVEETSKVYEMLVNVSANPRRYKASDIRTRTTSIGLKEYKTEKVTVTTAKPAAVEGINEGTSNQPVVASNKKFWSKRDTSIWDKMRMSKQSPYYHAWQLGAELTLSETFRSIKETESGIDTGYIRLRNKAEKPTRTHSFKLNVQYNFNRYFALSTGVGFTQLGYKANSGKYLTIEVDSLGNQKEKLNSYNSRVSYNFISVPLELRISPVVIRSFSISAYAGVNTMFIIRDKGVTPSNVNRSPVTLENDEQLVRYNPRHYTLSYGFSVNSYLTRRLQLSIQPTWSKSLNSLYTTDMKVDERFKNKGITVGMSYGF